MQKLRFDWALWPVLLTIPLGWWLSSGTVAVPPNYLLIFGAVTGLILGAPLIARSPLWVCYLLAGLLGILATHRLFDPGIPITHDTLPHSWAMYALGQSIAEGNLLPRWVHEIGLGIPLFMFYPLLPFVVGIPFLLTQMPATEALKFSFVLFSAVGAITMFWVMLRWTDKRQIALYTAAIYSFAPAHMLLSNYRGALAEAAAMMVLPLFFYFLQQILTLPTVQHRIGMVISGSLLLLLHPLSYLMALVGGVFFVGGYCRTLFQTGRYYGHFLLFTLWSVLLAGFYTLPLVIHSGQVSVASELGSYKETGLNPFNWLDRAAWDAVFVTIPGAALGTVPEMAYYFGLALFALLPLAWRARYWQPVTSLLALTTGTLLLTLFPFNYLAWLIPPLEYLQFPWRFLSIATFGASALAGFALLRLSQPLHPLQLHRVLPAVVFVLVLVDFAPYTGAGAWFRLERDNTYESHVLDALQPPGRVYLLSIPPAPSENPLAIVSPYAFPEYLTPPLYDPIRFGTAQTAELAELGVGGVMEESGWVEPIAAAPFASFVATEASDTQALDFQRGGGEITISLPATEGTLIIREMWFPHWQAKIGRTTYPVTQTESGLMQITIPENSGSELFLTFRRFGTAERIGLALTLLALAGMGVMYWRRVV